MKIETTTTPKPIFTKPAYSVNEAAELFGVHTNTIYKLCRSGELNAYMVSGSWRIPGEALEGLRVPARENMTGPRPKKKGTTK